MSWQGQGQGLHPQEPSFVVTSVGNYRAGDRKIIYNPREEDREYTEKPPKITVVVSRYLGWALAAAGMSSIIISRISEYEWPKHWLGLLAFLIGILSTMVDHKESRGGKVTNFIIPMGVVAIASSCLILQLFDYKLYSDVQDVEDCEDSLGNPFCVNEKCFCFDPVRNEEVCLNYKGDCVDITENIGVLFASVVMTAGVAVLSTAVLLVNTCVCLLVAPPDPEDELIG